MAFNFNSREVSARYAVSFAAALLMISLNLLCESLPVSSMKWMLGPIASIVELLSGDHFTLQDGGYVNITGNIVLGPTCTGINFMTITVLMSVFSFLPGLPLRKQMILAPLLMISAFLLTVLVNSSRISIAMKLVERSISAPALATDSVHEAQGVLYYLFFLLVYYFALKYLFTKTTRNAPAA